MADDTNVGNMDPNLVIRAQQGDEQAFESIVSDVHPRLFRVAVSVLGEPATAEDATQQALLTMWRSLPRLRDPQAFDAWSYRLLVRACYAEAARRPGWMPESAIKGATEPTGEDQLAGVADREQLARGFARLSLEHRMVIVLRYMLDWPVARVAEALEIPPGTVGSRGNRALAALRAALEADARPSRSAVGERRR